ncbi:MAG: hypothetical protein IKK94_06825 [Clostridia bacterium]|nr:hypothetical protein [Clostridia bacterium]
MFGYVKPYVPELKMIENQYYKAAYCGLCRAMRDETGIISRMTLSYDITFLALIRLALHPEKPSFDKKRCFVHPMKKKTVMKSCDALTYSAHAGTLLTYHKICDDISDERGTKKLKAKILRLVFSSSYKKAKKGYEELDLLIKSRLDELHSLEKEMIRSADRPAAIFGSLMASVTSFGIEEDENRLISEAIGNAVGKFIYIADALDDLEEDKKKNSYNPFLLLFDGNELDNEKKLDIEGAIKGILRKASDAIDLAPLDGRRDLEGLIRNIITLGMPRICEGILFPERIKNNENILKTEINDD